jgi:outer membrane lipoprotein SlyB
VSSHLAGCPTCHQTFRLGSRVGGKVGGLLVGAAVGGATKRPGLMLLASVFGALVGHWVDDKVLPSCPECRVALQVVDLVV